MSSSAFSLLLSVGVLRARGFTAAPRLAARRFSTATTLATADGAARSARIQRDLETGAAVSVKLRLDAESRAQLKVPGRLRSARLFAPTAETRTLSALHDKVTDALELPRSLAMTLTQKGADAPLATDADVVAFLAAGGPSSVHLDVGAAADPASSSAAAAPPYHRDLAPLPAEPDWAMVSFYSFSPVGDAEGLARALLAAWAPLGVVGRAYTADEGINAQLVLPKARVEPFEASVAALAELRDVVLNYDVDVPHAEFAANPPFRALHCRARAQVVADGLLDDAPLDWADNGTPVGPAEWHAMLDGADAGPAPVVLDCRNGYESDVGGFDAADARPLETETFKETWAALAAKLEGTPKDAPVMTFCTGGIRCVKVGAYLEQALGYTNVNRLQGGVVSYARWAREEAVRLDVDVDAVSKFRGVNFVFNDRLGELITKGGPPRRAAAGAGEAAAAATGMRDGRAIEAVALAVQRERLAANLTAVSPGASTAAGAAAAVTAAAGGPQRCDPYSGYLADDPIEAYAAKQTTAEPELLRLLRLETQSAFPQAAHMVSGPLQGRLLKMLTQLSRATRVLEVGTFTGYSSLCFAEALPAFGRVTTIERDPGSAGLAQRYFAASEHGGKIDLMHDDATAAVCRLADALAAGEHAQDGGALVTPYDLVLIDADKKICAKYYDLILDGGLLAQGGLLLVDNTLWKGRVVGIRAAGAGDKDAEPELPMPADATPAEEKAVRAARRAQRRDRALTQVMHEFNVKVRKDSRVEQVLLPLRDGLTLIRRVG